MYINIRTQLLINAFEKLNKEKPRVKIVPSALSMTLHRICLFAKVAEH